MIRTRTQADDQSISCRAIGQSNSCKSGNNYPIGGEIFIIAPITNQVDGPLATNLIFFFAAGVRRLTPRNPS